MLVGAVLLTASLDTITRAYTPADPKLGDNSVFCAMMNLASLQGYFSPFYGTNGPLWTLGMEIHFYVFYPLLFLAFRRFKGVNVAATLLVISILAWLAAVNGLVSKSSFLPYWFCWTVGAFIAECQYSSTEWPLKCMVTLSIPCLILALSADFWNRFVPFPSPVLFTIAVPPLGVIVWWVVNRSIWNGRFVSILASTGEFSYSLYATHLPVIVAYRAVFQNGKPSGDFLSIIPGIAVAIIFAKIFFLCVEKWSIRVPKTVRPKH